MLELKEFTVEQWQPIAADDVASARAEVTLNGPVNGMIEVAGPRTNRSRRIGRKLLGATSFKDWLQH